MPIALIGCLYALKLAVTGYSESGTVAQASSLPWIGSQFKGFESDGPVAYYMHYDPHKHHIIVIVGYTSKASIVQLFEDLDAMVLWQHQSAAELNEHLLGLVNDTSKMSTFWNQGFGQDDLTFEAAAGGESLNFSGGFREQDGWFAIIVDGIISGQNGE